MKLYFGSRVAGIRMDPKIMRVLKRDKLSHEAMELFHSIFQAEVKICLERTHSEQTLQRPKYYNSPEVSSDQLQDGLTKP